MRERLLTRHFLQRFVDNDLISPRADRHQVLSICGAALVSSGIVLSLFLSMKFLVVSFQTPGQTAMTALGDRFFFIGASCLVMALAAVGVWNAVSLDERDTEVLGPLPIPFAIILRAKAKAVVVLAAMVVLALNLPSSVMYPIFMSNNLRMGPGGVAVLVIAHFAATVAAGLFGFLAIVALREVVRLGTGALLFARISAVLQACLVILLGGMLLLLPSAMSEASAWVSSRVAYAIPPMWFLGLHEQLAGGVIAGLPARAYPEGVAHLEADAIAAYMARRPGFESLAGTATAALAIALVIASASYVWNNRKLSPGRAARMSRGLGIGVGSFVLTRLLVRSPSTRAGFFFGLRALWRSPPHRLSLASALGAGTAMALVFGRDVQFQPIDDVMSAPLGLLAAQIALVTLASLGFQHAVRVPAELRANWTFHLCWRGDETGYLGGVKLAGFLTLCAPILLAVLPIAAPVLGWRLALTHAAFGTLLALLLFEFSLFQFRRWPFASSYVPDEGLKAVASIYILLFAVVTYVLASIERAALGTTAGSVAFLGVLLVAWIVTRRVDAAQRREFVTRLLEVPEEGQVGLNMAEW